MSNFPVLTIGIPLVGAVFTIIVGTLTGMSNLPSFQRRRVLQSLQLVSKNYINYIEHKKTLKGRVVPSNFSIFTFGILSVFGSFIVSQYNPPGHLEGDLLVFPLFIAIFFLIYSNSLVIYYLRITVHSFKEFSDPIQFAANIIASEDQDPGVYGLPKISPEEAKSNFKKWKNAYVVTYWARLTFNYQFIMWALALFSIAIYSYGYLNNILYFYTPINETYLNFLLSLLIGIIGALMIYGMRYSKDLDKNQYAIFSTLYRDISITEQITFYTNFGQIRGLIDIIGSKLTIRHIEKSDNEMKPSREEHIVLNWKNILAVSLESEIDNKLDKSLIKYRNDKKK